MTRKHAGCLSFDLFIGINISWLRQQPSTRRHRIAPLEVHPPSTCKGCILAFIRRLIGFEPGRLKSRGIYDKETIHGVINSALVVNVAFIDEEGLPTIVPMNGQVEEDEDGPYVLLHGR